MKNKFFISFIISFIISILVISYSFAANDNIVENIRNTVGGAENAIEGVGNSITSGIKNVTKQSENMMENMTTSTNNATGTMNYNSSNNNYNATRTATANRSITYDDNNTFLGISPTLWTWIIMGIVGIAIVALVWNYGKQYSDYEDNNY